jgi:hypothetical protein
MPAVILLLSVIKDIQYLECPLFFVALRSIGVGAHPN